MATEVSEQVEVVEAADSAALAVGAGRPAGQVESVAGGLSSQALVGAGLDPERSAGADLGGWLEELGEQLRRVAAVDSFWLAGFMAGARRALARRIREGSSATAPADTEVEADSDDEADSGDEADRLTSLLHYYGELTSIEQAELVSALGKRLAHTDEREVTDDQADSAGQADDDETDEEEEEESESGRLSGLATLMEESDDYEFERSDPMLVLGPRDVVAALFFDLRRVEMALAGARQGLEAMNFTFDWQTDDLSIEREAGLAALGDAEDIIDGVRAPLIRWARMFSASRLLALDSKTMLAVRELAGSIPNWCGIKVEFVVRAAVLHLAGEPGAAAIIAKAERDRQARRVKETGIRIHPNDKLHWPWHVDGGGAEESEPTVSGAETAGDDPDAKPGTGKRVETFQVDGE